MNGNPHSASGAPSAFGAPSRSDGLRSVDEHLAQILSMVAPLAPLDLALSEAQGTVLAEPVPAPIPLPPFDNSAMDGYAVVSTDVANASETSPVTLSVIGDVAAGDTGICAIRPGLCTRIMTGAPIPAGADTVVPVEWTDGGTVSVRITRPAPPGQHIRRAGDDVPAGQVVLRPGVRLHAPQLGMLATVGRARVTVRPRPRVVVLSTGDELREPGSTLAPGQIWDSNSFMLTAAVNEAGGVGFRESALADMPENVLDALREHLTRADAVITTGGVSMGARDVVKEALTGTLTFTKVAMRPGKPQGFGLLDGVPVFTLPGNPVSAYVSFQVFVRPALQVMQGLTPEPPQTATAVLTEDVRSPAGLRHYLRGRLHHGPDGLSVAPAQAQGSHQMSALASADALIVVPEERDVLRAGERVAIWPLPR